MGHLTFIRKPEEDPDDERLIRHQQQQVQPLQNTPAPPPAPQQVHPTQASRRLGPARPESPYFESSSPPNPKHAPATNTAPSDFNDSFAMDDIEMDDQFLQEIEEAEKRVLNGSQPATERSAQSTSRPANTEIIELDSSSDSDEQPAQRPPPKRAARVPIDTIDLSD
jgi:hypothetical protein